jgi:NIMA (never in mitosis gene a)-related kinase
MRPNNNPDTKYEKIKLIGQGSFAQTYLVKEVHSRKQYAMKSIKLDGLKEKEYNNSLEEAFIIKRLDHPNIIKLYEAFLCQNPRKTLNLIIEYANGGDLLEKIKIMKEKNRYLKEDLILDYFTQICLALYHIHKKKIIHRDIKANNVFLTKNGIIKLGDFGISKQLSNTWNFAETVVGTPYHLAPEIIQNQPYDTKADIWALGVLLYQLITLEYPFQGSNIPILFFNVLAGKYKQIPLSFSNELRNLVRNIFEIDPRKRPSIRDILQYSILKKRMSVFLTEVNYNKDFSSSFINNIIIKKKNKNNNNDNLHKPFSSNDVKKNVINNNNNNDFYEHNPLKNFIIQRNSPDLENKLENLNINNITENNYEKFRNERDYYDANRILDNYNNLIYNKETIDYDKTSNDNSLDLNSTYLDDKLVPDPKGEPKANPNLLTKSVIQEEDKKQINEIKKELMGFFGDKFESLFVIFNNYCDKEKIGINVEGVRLELFKNGMSTEQIDVILKKSPEFICLCINNIYD